MIIARTDTTQHAGTHRVDAPVPCVLCSQGPRGFTSAAGFEAEARHKQHLQQHASNVQDDGSLIVDTSHGTQFAHDLEPAQTMDKSSLQGEHAPKFVGGDLVDPVDTARGAAAAAGGVDKSHPHGVYSLVGALGWGAVLYLDGHSALFGPGAGQCVCGTDAASQSA